MEERPPGDEPVVIGPTGGRLRPVPPRRKFASEEPIADAHKRRLAELKRKIERGEYEPDPHRIAEEILRQGLDD